MHQTKIDFSAINSAQPRLSSNTLQYTQHPEHWHVRATNTMWCGNLYVCSMQKSNCEIRAIEMIWLLILMRDVSNPYPFNIYFIHFLQLMLNTLVISSDNSLWIGKRQMEGKGPSNGAKCCQSHIYICTCEESAKMKNLT